MFIDSWLHKFFAAPEERNAADAIVTYNISLRWSSGLLGHVRFYKHSAPPELARLVAA